RAHTPQDTTRETANEDVNRPTTTPHRLKIKLGGAGGLIASYRHPAPAARHAVTVAPHQRPSYEAPRQQAVREDANRPGDDNTPWA
ncbi:hypothetical protein ACFZDK_54235, partial [Streptomyces sp. NPDC007901]|uniref:hypothetical protein n=1 Tax=Streptomyces sp. NPDC007901 TaxID=3364785 RepID=UPI0036E3C3E5